MAGHFPLLSCHIIDALFSYNSSCIRYTYSWNTIIWYVDSVKLIKSIHWIAFWYVHYFNGHELPSEREKCRAPINLYMWNTHDSITYENIICQCGRNVLRRNESKHQCLVNVLHSFACLKIYKITSITRIQNIHVHVNFPEISLCRRRWFVLLKDSFFLRRRKKKHQPSPSPKSLAQKPKYIHCLALLYSLPFIYRSNNVNFINRAPLRNFGVGMNKFKWHWLSDFVDCFSMWCHCFCHCTICILWLA